MKPKIVTIQAKDTEQIAFHLRMFGAGLILFDGEISMEDLVVVEIECDSGNTVLCPTSAYHNLKLADGTFVYLLRKLEPAKVV